jgi:citrate lyase subunit beta/citryl-CoA lyase
MANTVRPRRSVLYMPGSNSRAMEKAAALPADALILDLEDAVAPDAKDVARRQVRDAVAARPFGKREVIVRVNGLGTPWGKADLAAVAPAGPDAILVPKIDRASDVREAAAACVGAAAPQGTHLWAMIETPKAIFNVNEIAGAEPRLACLVMGTNDLVKEMRGAHSLGREGLLAALSLSVLAARAHGRTVLDGVYNDIADVAGFEAVCAQGRALGFDGKTLIHPSQIEICNRAFSPDAAEVARARAILAAFASPENRAKGAISLDGRMVELLHAEIAKETVALADAIARLEAP